jgi:hypothetical protein
MLRLTGVQQASFPVGAEILSSGVKQPGCEANHSLSFSDEVMSEWSYTFTPPYVCIVWCLVKHQPQLYFVFSEFTLKKILNSLSDYGRFQTFPIAF